MSDGGPVDLVIRQRRALEALRAGVPSRDAVGLLGSGQAEIEDRFLALVERAGGGDAGGMLLGGGFGSGKSHLLQHLAQLALNAGFVVSRVVISKETPLHDPVKVFRAAADSAVVAGRFRGKEPDRGIRLAWAAAGTWIALNLPFAIWGTTGWLEFFQNSKSRSASWNSLWNAACKLATGQGCANTSLINVASLVLFVAWVVVIWVVKAKRDPGFARWTLGFPILVVFLLSNKVYSPQFSLWLLPWFALALPNLRLFIAFEAIDVVVFLTEFGWLGANNGVRGGLTDIPSAVFELAILVRAGILVLCVIDWIRRRDPPPEPESLLPTPDEVRAHVPA